MTMAQEIIKVPSQFGRVPIDIVWKLGQLAKQVGLEDPHPLEMASVVGIAFGVSIPDDMPQALERRARIVAAVEPRDQLLSKLVEEVSHAIPIYLMLTGREAVVSAEH